MAAAGVVDSVAAAVGTRPVTTPSVMKGLPGFRQPFLFAGLWSLLQVAHL